MNDLKRRRDEEPELPESWSERARDAARRFKLPIPEEVEPPEEVERRLRQVEQQDGE